MNEFNINKVIDQHNLHTELAALAAELFPEAKHPRHALMRILKGESELGTTQIQCLAKYIGVTVGDLFNDSEWKGKTEDGVLTFIKGAYKVKLAYQGVFLSLYKDGKLIDQKVANIPAMTMREFLNYIDKLIKVS